MTFVGSLFTFKGKMTRLPYLIRMVTITVVLFGLTMFGAAVLSGLSNNHALPWIFFGIMVAIFLWSYVSLNWRRTRDMGSNPWLFLILGCVPYVSFVIGVVLFVAPTQYESVINKPVLTGA